MNIVWLIIWEFPNPDLTQSDVCCWRIHHCISHVVCCDIFYTLQPGCNLQVHCQSDSDIEWMLRRDWNITATALSVPEILLPVFSGLMLKMLVGQNVGKKHFDILSTWTFKPLCTVPEICLYGRKSSVVMNNTRTLRHLTGMQPCFCHTCVYGAVVWSKYLLWKGLIKQVISSVGFWC